uniref:Calcineurin-like phosphoesterase domain-containing protein n=1 Tax=Asterionellopsis glacialis TaxID=33640 RepID=A0A7S0PWM6_9STRA|mmetsp:Transcript_1205/g.1676  ORF Transcript_1205/g.1676 Transcript_1205/m.1676 type:complete len:611 (+) Transcript_1205:41-1873(+)
MVFGRKEGGLGYESYTDGRGGDEEVPAPPNQLMGASALMGKSSGVSLDGQSLILPDDANFSVDDDMSSINTSLYGGARGYGGGNVDPGPIAGVGVGDFVQDDPSILNEDPSILGGVVPPPHPEVVSTGTSSNGGGGGGGNTRGEDTRGMSNGKGNREYKMDDDDDGWLPGWVTGASPCLKGIIIASTALLVGALVLVVVAAVVAGNDSGSTSSRFNGGDGNSIDFTFAPIGTPVPTLSPSAAPTSAPTSSASPTSSFSPTPIPSAVPTNKPTNSPTVSVAPSEPGDTRSPTTEPSASPSTSQPSASPTNVPSSAPSTSEPTMTPSIQPTPVYQDTGNLQTFYITAGRFTETGFPDFQEKIAKLPTYDDSAFFVHLGDWNSPGTFNGECPKAEYEKAYNWYSAASVPTLFVMGDNEYNDCNNPSQAYNFWLDYFETYYEEHWEKNKDVKVKHQNERPENWAFVSKRILFVGINLVGGRKHDVDEWATRFQNNLDWVEKTHNDNKDKADAIFIFAHASPKLPDVVPFYDDLLNMVNTTFDALPTVIVNRNLGSEGWFDVTNYEGIRNLVLLVVKGQVFPPMKVQMDAAARRFSAEQSDWFDEMEDAANIMSP